jgi:hypothetical protein
VGVCLEGWCVATSGHGNQAKAVAVNKLSTGKPIGRTDEPSFVADRCNDRPTHRLRSGVADPPQSRPRDRCWNGCVFLIGLIGRAPIRTRNRVGFWPAAAPFGPCLFRQKWAHIWGHKAATTSCIINYLACLFARVRVSLTRHRSLPGFLYFLHSVGRRANRTLTGQMYKNPAPCHSAAQLGMV